MNFAESQKDKIKSDGDARNALSDKSGGGANAINGHVTSTSDPNSTSDTVKLDCKHNSSDPRKSYENEATTLSGTNNAQSSNSRLAASEDVDSISSSTITMTPPTTPLSKSAAADATATSATTTPSSTTTTPATSSSSYPTPPPSLTNTVDSDLRLLVQPSMELSAKLSVPVLAARYLCFEFTPSVAPVVCI